MRGLVAPALARAVNDNARDGADPDEGAARFDPVLTDALRHFAVHGLASAEAAVEAAAEAGQCGDPTGQEHWLAITRMFDRRLAARAVRELAPA